MARPSTKQSRRPAGEFARLPAVSGLLSAAPIAALVRKHGRGLITDLLREQLAALREDVREGRLAAQELRRAVTTRAIAEAVARTVADLLAPRPRMVINATGVVVHTNLGRAPLSPAAARQVAEAASGYLDLEYDLAGRGRGDRITHLEPLLRRLFPGQAYAVVNNNAAAVMLCLRALGRGKEVLISRGELVEIGGSFRIPDILAASGARLREVGTTNRTRVGDYEAALSKKSALILKVHTSNFKIVGFTEEPRVSSLARLARRAGLPLVVDWGSGDLIDLAPLGVRDELPVGRILEAGADIVTFSGDKLLGGPQAGFIVGGADLMARVRRDPLARVVRLDRLLLGAVHQTLAAYVRGTALDDVPVLRMIAASAEEIGRRARRVVREVAGRSAVRRKLLSVIEGVSRTGGGSSPLGERPTRLVCVAAPGGDVQALERRLRGGTPPVIARIREDRLLLDLRTVPPEQDAVLVERLRAALG